MKKYIIKIPDPDTNVIVEKVFYKIDDVTNFLGVGNSVVYAMLKGEYCFEKNKHLSKIKISKEDMSKSEKIKIKMEMKADKKIEEEPYETQKIKEFHRQLISK